MSLRLLLLGLVLLLAACNRNPLEVVISRCPAVAIVGDTGTITRFNGESRLQENIVFTASMGEVTSSCDQGGKVVSEVTFRIYARAGAAFTGQEITLPYFVGILKDNSQLVTKKQYDVTLRLNSDGIAETTQSLEAVVPTIDQARRYNYEVLIGFQADYNDVYFNLVR